MLYELPTSGNIWHVHLSHNLRAISFKQTRFEPYVWTRGCEEGYNYIGTHTDDIPAVAFESTSIFSKWKETYIINAFGSPKVYLVYDY